VPGEDSSKVVHSRANLSNNRPVLSRENALMAGAIDGKGRTSSVMNKLKSSLSVICSRSGERGGLVAQAATALVD